LSKEGFSDKLGVVEVNAEGLLSNEVIDINAEILNDNGDKVGHIFLKIFWFESQRDSDPVAP
jgi:hypothetical protein